MGCGPGSSHGCRRGRHTLQRYQENAKVLIQTTSGRARNLAIFEPRGIWREADRFARALALAAISDSVMASNAFTVERDFIGVSSVNQHPPWAALVRQDTPQDSGCCDLSHS